MKFRTHYEVHLNWAEALTREVLRNAPSPSPVTDTYRADLAGLLSTAYIAAFECCIKEIFINFAASKHKIAGNMAGYHFEQINSKIHWQVIGDKYAGQFGVNYRKKYYELIADEETVVFKNEKVSLKKTYENLLTWRHAFAHEGKKLATLEEVSKAFPVAKRIIFKVDEAMSI